jgi:hypothetical protein
MTNYAMGTYVGMVEEDLVGAIPLFEKAVRIFPPFAEPQASMLIGSEISVLQPALRPIGTVTITQFVQSVPGYG